MIDSTHKKVTAQRLKHTTRTENLTTRNPKGVKIFLFRIKESNTLKRSDKKASCPKSTGHDASIESDKANEKQTRRQRQAHQDLLISLLNSIQDPFLNLTFQPPNTPPSQGYRLREPVTGNIFVNRRASKACHFHYLL